MLLYGGIMKLSHDLVVLDLETVGTHDAITECAAVILDRHTLEIKDTFSQLVNPEKPIEENIIKITNITNEMVATAPKFPEMIKNFEEWVIKNSKKLKNVRLCAFGIYFDSPVLRRCYKNYGLDYPFSGSWFDVKSFVFMWAALSGRKTERFQQVGGCVEEMKLTRPAGEYHRALVDAQAEAAILQKVFRDLSEGHFLLGEHGQPGKYIKIGV